MAMSRKGSVCLATLVLTLAAGTAVAADLPKSGKFTIHSGWKAISQATQVADNHIILNASFWGVTYNDTGAGPLHMGAVSCSGAADLVSGAGPAKGYCAWGDADGDKIFTDYSGTVPKPGEVSGMNRITGGTGKFAGVQGTAPFQCQDLNTSGQFTCKQQFEYRLP